MLNTFWKRINAEPERFRAAAHGANQEARRCRPSFEVLEDRTAPAMMFAVTNLLDNGNNANPIPGSLRDGIVQVNNPNNANQPNAIAFAGAARQGTLTLTVRLPAIVNDLTITGPAANQVTVQRSNAAGTPTFDIFSFE
jgi:hypothetical protein